MRKGKVTQKTIYSNNIDLLAAIGTKIGRLPVLRYFELLEKLEKIVNMLEQQVNSILNALQLLRKSRLELRQN